MILAVPEDERRGPFFTVLTKEGKPYSRKRHQVGKIIAELGRKAGIVVKAHQKTGEKEFASAHDLRRSFGERWAKRVEAQFLQKMCDIRRSLRRCDITRREMRQMLLLISIRLSIAHSLPR